MPSLVFYLGVALPGLHRHVCGVLEGVAHIAPSAYDLRSSLRAGSGQIATSHSFSPLPLRMTLVERWRGEVLFKDYLLSSITISSRLPGHGLKEVFEFSEDSAPINTLSTTSSSCPGSKYKINSMGVVSENRLSRFGPEW